MVTLQSSIQQAQARHIEAFYASLPEQARTDVDNICAIWRAHGQDAASHAYSKLILARELATWQAVALGSVIRARCNPNTRGH